VMALERATIIAERPCTIVAPTPGTHLLLTERSKVMILGNREVK
jgi:hypothetical protein